MEPLIAGEDPPIAVDLRVEPLIAGEDPPIAVDLRVEPLKDVDLDFSNQFLDLDN